MFKVFFVGLSLVLFSNSVEASDFQTVDTTTFIAEYSKTTVKGNYGIIVLGGSGGGKPMVLANKFKGLGHSVLSLAYFKEEGLPAELNEIPLEYFKAPKEWLLKQEETNSKGVILVAWSKGAELSLLLASIDPTIKGVVAIAPSSALWAGILKDWRKVPSSSWTEKGTPLDHVAFATGVQITNLVDLYAESLKQKEMVLKARIPVENIKADVLLLSGGQDEIWPSDQMAKTICKTMQRAKKSCQHINYPGAGHLLDKNIIIGGSQSANEAADKESTMIISKFVKGIKAN